MESTNDLMSRLAGLGDQRTPDENIERAEDAAVKTTESTAELDEHVVYFEEEGDTGGPSLSTADLEVQRKTQRQLEKLQFINPGGQNVVSGVLGRRTRKKKSMVTQSNKNRAYHDKNGRLVVNGESGIVICDCLVRECPGCHWPCVKCGKRLCGPVCQSNRNSFVSSVKVQGGSNPRTLNPYVKSSK